MEYYAQQRQLGLGSSTRPSQIPGFPRSQNEWIASKDGAVELAEVIEDNGGETVLMMTWGRRNGDSTNSWRFPDFSTMQDELESGYLDYRDNISANGGNGCCSCVRIVFEYIHDKIVAGFELLLTLETRSTISTLMTEVILRFGSYLAAVVLYATITGNDPVGLSHSTSLSKWPCSRTTTSSCCDRIQRNQPP